MKTHRLFFALWPSPQVRSNIEKAVHPVLHDLHGRITPIHDLHMTLHYVGSSTDEMRDCLHEAATSIKFTPFQLSLDHFGYFKKARVMWMGVNAIPAELDCLQKDLGDALSGCEFHGDKRPYTPHVSLVKKCTDPVQLYEGGAVVWTVEDFVLVESVPCDRGVTYQVLERYMMV